MKQDHDFAALRQLLAAQKPEPMPSGQIDRFLIELHRRQRVALLVPPLSFWQRFGLQVKTLGEKMSWGPSLSYGATLATMALFAVSNINQQFVLRPAFTGGMHLSLGLPGNRATFAMIPGAVSLPGGMQASDNSGIGIRPDARESTRFVLSGSNLAYDATATF